MKGLGRAGCLVVTTALLCSSPLGRAATLVFLPFLQLYFSAAQTSISLFSSTVFVCALARLLFTVNYGILNQWSIVVLHQWPRTASCFNLFDWNYFSLHCKTLPISCINWTEKCKKNPSQSKTSNIKIINRDCHIVLQLCSVWWK